MLFRSVINQQRDWPIAEMFARQLEITAPILASEDAREGASAFAQNRKPEWKGR